jgi:ABC-2 type transport system ATP-binding protein
MHARSPEADRLCAVLTGADMRFRRLAPDVVAVDGVTPEQLGPLLASQQIVLYELTNEGADLEAIFLELTSGLGFNEVGKPT